MLGWGSILVPPFPASLGGPHVGGPRVRCCNPPPACSADPLQHFLCCFQIQIQTLIHFSLTWRIWRIFLFFVLENAASRDITAGAAPPITSGSAAKAADHRRAVCFRESLRSGVSVPVAISHGRSNSSSSCCFKRENRTINRSDRAHWRWLALGGRAGQMLYGSAVGRPTDRGC